VGLVDPSAPPPAETESSRGINPLALAGILSLVLLAGSGAWVLGRRLLR
jgi:hypothetical protein